MRRFMLRLIMICVGVIAGWVDPTYGQTDVRVIGYPFPPFINEDKKTGLTPDLLALLNRQQKDYRFSLTVVDPELRYRALMSDDYDMILFEMPKWEWLDKMDRLEQSRILMKGGEVYVARRQTKRTPTFFSDIKSKRIAVYEGYHYAFADYKADKKWLRENFKIEFAQSHHTILKMVENGDVDIGIVTLSFLKQLFARNPEEISKYRISDEFAQVYELRTLLKKDAPLSLKKFEKILSDLKRNFVLEEFLEENGILHQWRF